MLTRIATLLTVVTLTTVGFTGCKKDKNGAPAAAEAVGNDWSRPPLDSHSLTLDGVAFTVSIPRGLPRGRDASAWSNDQPQHDTDPKVFISVSSGTAVQTLDDALADAMIDATKAANLARKEARPTGFAFTDVAADKHRVEARTLTRVGDKLIHCTATQVTEGELPSFAATKAMLEKICDSVKPT